MDAYNTAIKYMKATYGHTDSTLTYHGAGIEIYNKPTDDFGKHIDLLLHQYQYGRAVRYELKALLERNGIQ